MTLFKSLSIYTFASFFNKGLVFVLAFIISHYLSKSDWGILAWLNVSVLLTSIFIGVGAKGALAVKYFQFDRKLLNQYFSALLISPVLIFVLLIVLSLILKSPISSFLELPPIWIFYIIVLAFSQVINDLTLTLYRIQDKPKSFAYFNISLGLINFLLSLFLIIGLDQSNWQGRALGIIGSTAIFALLSLAIFLKKQLFTLNFKSTQVKEMLHFGVPLIPHLMGAFAIEYSDTIFIKKMLGEAELGLYSWGYKFGMIIQILVSSFSMGYGPFLFASLKDLNRKLEIKNRSDRLLVFNRPDDRGIFANSWESIYLLLVS